MGFKGRESAGNRGVRMCEERRQQGTRSYGAGEPTLLSDKAVAHRARGAQETMRRPLRTLRAQNAQLVTYRNDLFY